MLDKRLEKLAKYANEIEKTKPIDFLNQNITSIEDDLKNLSKDQIQSCKKFEDELRFLIKRYQDDGLYTPALVCSIYNELLIFLKMYLIELKAESLGVSKEMYSKDMDFLFKGKF